MLHQLFIRSFGFGYDLLDLGFFFNQLLPQQDVIFVEFGQFGFRCGQTFAHRLGCLFQLADGLLKLVHPQLGTMQAMDEGFWKDFR